ncbi:DoxX family protein [Paenibacillus glycinis]|uniref:DoxX family protein n=1 Tax=Paenibacillus glycinis TaxID=2697035 RepID=A0ABW9XU83_9BACL|nr:DoxX family protein [Paenibacillus glycinis]NBD26170.1 DoxX family protein [Paenibacillus glycinis]
MSIVSLVLQMVLILAFLLGGGMNVAGVKAQIEAFDHLRLPQWFRVVTGLFQLIGIAGLVIGFWKPGILAWAGAWFAVMMLIAVVAHVRVKDSFGKALPALVLAIIAIVLLAANAEGFRRPFS